ncbi:glycosyltransferase family 2 protein [Paenibacillus mendelii]|uniref:Glycosyltransferase family 2 protein n=1 Tax=Paenibacillus mendelii TaxID=206163 RepID=A0ABV6JA60_9BACL|nr:glycosyltransferase family A protein [Paenibacillus mendelii]MCQ6559707.1 glycosyltransferase family 2 protein [Paenibacillus mendelii]
MNTSLVTVVVPTYNKEKFIKNALNSISMQTYTDWRLLVIDDASTDGTVGIIKKNIDPDKTRLIELKENKGICHVLNTALKHIDTKYFVQVDGDDWIEPNALETMLTKMEKEPRTTAMAYANTVHWIHKNGIDRFNEMRQRKAFKDKYDFVTYESMVQLRFYRTDCVRGVDGWETDDPSKGRILEDRRMVLRLLDKYKLCYVNKYLYHLRNTGKNLSSDKYARAYSKAIVYFTDRALRRWGNKYKAKYSHSPSLWPKIQLIRVKKK